MFILGITGGMGSGKSTAANYFLKKGAVVFDADLEAKILLERNKKIISQIITQFGNQILTGNQIDIFKLSKFAFTSKQNQQNLNKIIWPKILKIIHENIQKEENNKTSLFIVDAALLIEAGYHNLFNSILLITAEASIRINRLKERNNIPHDQIKKRMNLQMPEDEKRKHADIIIENNLSKDELFNKLDNLLTNYNLLN
tara:strand:+ start:16 stop:612 length:597 start_codon:yes stop_codon:yes gene_type:complete